MPTTPVPPVPRGPTTIDVSSRTARHDAIQAANAAFANGDLVFAEDASRRVLAVDCEHREALSLLLCVLARQNRHVEAIAFVDGVLAHFRALQDANTVVHALLQLQRRGFEPRGVLDIGAYQGELAMFARQMFPKASILMVEPQERAQEFLRELAHALGGDCHVERSLLGDRVRSAVEFHQLDTPFGSTGSSIYPEVSDFPRQVLTLPMRTVDDLVAGHPGRIFDLVKIDVQGAELDVLRGAAEAIHRVEVLIAELSLHEVNRGAPRLAEVVAEVDGLGLQLFDLLTLPRTNGLLYQVDAVFVRKTSPLWARTAR